MTCNVQSNLTPTIPGTLPTSACQVVLTGIGCVSPFGVGKHTLVADIIRNNSTAIRPIAGFPTDKLSRHLGAEIPSAYLPSTEETRRWSRISLMATIACREAIADANLTESEARARMGLVLGTEYGDLRSTEAFDLGFLRRGPRGLSPLLFPNTVMNAMAGTASLALGIKGPMLTLNQPGVAGEVAVARAINLIRAGRASAVVTCGVDELFPTLYEVLARFNVLSPHDGQEEICRPFDQRHNGPILGEGATALMIESTAHAQARNAPILAEIYSARWGGLAVRPSRYPSRHQMNQRIFKQVLQDAAVCSADIGMAYLSGSGEPQHDTAELDCLATMFGNKSPIITSVTHLTGAYGGLGAFRVAAAAVTLTKGVLPSLDYLQQPIRSDLRFAKTDEQQPAQRTIMVHGLARGGTQAVLLLGPPRQRAQS
ncbi:MAG: beta-ketoacyl synthase N-terminal-like domain-containing protein [bacterium]|nr:beta-ketoacyl synthase N-terminal-like domain-containing protein [bacterium]